MTSEDPGVAKARQMAEKGIANAKAARKARRVEIGKQVGMVAGAVGATIPIMHNYGTPATFALPIAAVGGYVGTKVGGALGNVHHAVSEAQMRRAQQRKLGR